jgi:DNA sulfur modification protein DndE
MPLEHIRLSEQARDQLIKLKRFTGIQHWNVLCRWAFCVSLAEPTVPSPVRIPSDSSVEMTWKVFGGAYEEIYLALLKERCQRDGLGTSDEILATQFRLHLHRGIAYLAADKQLKTVAGLVERIVRPPAASPALA